jgi:integrase
MDGVYKRGKIWYIDYYANGRRIRERIGENKKLAQTVLRKRKVEVAEYKHLDIKRDKKVTFEDFAQKFYNLHSRVNKKPSAFDRDKFLINKLGEFFRGCYISGITPMMVEEYKAKRIREQKKPATINREVACLKCIINKAIEWGYMHDNPVRKVKLLKENNTRMRFLKREEVERLLKECDELTKKDPRYKHLKPALIIALNTGLRKRELLDLKWQDIDLQTGIIYLTDTKNNERREAPMNEIVKKTFSEIRRYPGSPYIFHNKDGDKYYKLDKSFFTALKKSGIIDFHWHDLRHTFASHLVMNGVDIKTVQELMGHKSIEMTLRYSHLSQGHKQSAVELLGKNMVTNWSQTPKNEK